MKIFFSFFYFSFSLQGPCRQGGEYLSETNQCYYIGGVRHDPDKFIGLKENAITFVEAESECQKIHGHLVTINDGKTWNLIKEIPFLSLAKDLVWIGLYRDIETRNFKWTDPSQEYSDFKQKHWALGQPIDRERYDCTNLKLRDVSGSMNVIDIISQADV